MYINHACLILLFAVPAWSQSKSGAGQMRLHIPVWDLNDLYSRITGAFHTPHVKQKNQRKDPVDTAAIDDYYNDFWENYYYNNPPVVEYVPRPPPRPRPTRRPTRRTTTTTTTTTAAPTTAATTTPATSTTSTTTTTTTTTPPPETTDPPETTPVPTSNSTNQPVRDENPEDILKPASQLTIKSPPKSMSSLCYNFPKLCTKPEEAEFVELTDRSGNPFILISPKAISKETRKWSYTPTKRPLNQRRHQSRYFYAHTPKPQGKRYGIY